MAAAAMGVLGIGRSLWVDEAWVANSVIAPTLGGMFFYPDWLQTTPPLFLLLARWTVETLGLSNATLRIVPLLLAMVGLAAMWGVSRRVLPAPFALLALALVAFNPTAMEYSRTFKQYSGEMAVSALLLWAVAAFLQHSRMVWVTATVVVALPLAYSSAFLLPGVALALWGRRGSTRGSQVLSAVAVVELAVLYAVFARPNTSPELHAFWAASDEAGMTWTLAAGLAFAVFALVRARTRFEVACLLPCLLLAAAGTMGWYPGVPRTRLFVLPGFVLVAAMYAESAGRRLLRRWADQAAIAAAVALAVVGMWREVREERDRPFEDQQTAMRYLREQIAPEDRLVVHSSTREGFRLYAAMDGWSGPGPNFGDTGWPCCARGKNAIPGSSREEDVARDLARMVPAGFTGRVWLLFTTRPTHWLYTGLDEGELLRRLLWESGCPAGEYAAFPNLAVSAMECRAFRPRGLSRHELLHHAVH